MTILRKSPVGLITGHPVTEIAMRVWVALPKKAALYTMKTSQEQRLTPEPAGLAGKGRQPH
ncbi:MAG TPA: hypothetical protein VGI91_05845 [Steroidobacteraceae bacterium]